jgi:hypothetical protein
LGRFLAGYRPLGRFFCCGRLRPHIYTTEVLCSAFGGYFFGAFFFTAEGGAISRRCSAHRSALHLVLVLLRFYFDFNDFAI